MMTTRESELIVYMYRSAESAKAHVDAAGSEFRELADRLARGEKLTGNQRQMAAVTVRFLEATKNQAEGLAARIKRVVAEQDPDAPGD